MTTPGVRRGKAGSKADRGELRRLMLAQGRSLEEIAHEMSRRYGVSIRAAWRHAHGLTQDDVAAAYNQLGEDGRAGMTGSRICEFENWPGRAGKKPSITALIRLATIYQTKPRALLSVTEYGLLAAKDRLLLDKCDADAEEPSFPAANRVASSIRSGVVSLVKGGRPKSAQRQFAHQAQLTERHTSGEPSWQAPAILRSDNGSPNIAQELLIAAHESAEFGAQLDGEAVGETTTEQLYADVSRIARAYLNSPLLPLFNEMVYLRNRTFSLLEQPRQRLKQTRELYLLAGSLCGMLAYVSDDLGHREAAMTQARAAFICAEQAGHNGLRAWVRSLQSMVAYWDNRPHDSIRFAQAGEQYAATGTAPARLASLAGRAWARLGAASEATEAIERAMRERERAERGEDLEQLGGIFTFPTAKQLSYVGTSYAWLREAPNTIRNAESAITEYQRGNPEDRAYFDESVSRIDLAGAHLLHDALDSVFDVLDPVLDLPVSQRTDGINEGVARLGMMIGETKYRRSAEAEQLRERIRRFCGNTILCTNAKTRQASALLQPPNT